MPTPILNSVKTPPAVTSGVFGFVFQTTPLSRKDSSYDLLHDAGVRVQSR